MHSHWCFKTLLPLAFTELCPLEPFYDVPACPLALPLPLTPDVPENAFWNGLTWGNLFGLPGVIVDVTVAGG